MADFFQMGGYGFSVWLSWGIGLFVLGAVTAASLIERHRLSKADKR